MAQLTRKRVILIEEESSYGTDPTPAATDVVLVTDLSITPQSSDVVNRDVVRPYLGSSEQLLANTRVECTFSVELAGSGTAGTAPRYGDALKACGFAEAIVSSTSVTYTPVSASFSSVSIHYNIDGVRHIVTGCRGSFVVNAEVGSIPTIEFTFTGIYNAPTDNALPTVSYGNQATPLIFKNGNTTNFQLFEPNQANPQIVPIIIIHGVDNNNFSNDTKKNNNGSKNASMLSPYSFEKFLKAKSIPFLSSIWDLLPISGNSVKNSINIKFLRAYIK